MNLKLVVKKLRFAANALEDLLDYTSNETAETADKIREAIVTSKKRGKYKKRKKLHWTQTPEGRKKLSESMKKHHSKREN